MDFMINDFETKPLYFLVLFVSVSGIFALFLLKDKLHRSDCAPFSSTASEFTPRVQASVQGTKKPKPFHGAVPGWLQQYFFDFQRLSCGYSNKTSYIFILYVYIGGACVRLSLPLATGLGAKRPLNWIKMPLLKQMKSNMSKVKMNRKC